MKILYDAQGKGPDHEEYQWQLTPREKMRSPGEIWNDKRRRPQQTSREHQTVKGEQRKKSQQRKWANIVRRQENHQVKWVQVLGGETFMKSVVTTSNAKERL